MNSALIVAITALLSVLTGLVVVAMILLGYIAVRVNDLKSFISTVISLLRNTEARRRFTQKQLITKQEEAQ